jgi:hypothetical protein
MKSHVYICKDEEANKSLSLTYLKKYEILGISSDIHSKGSYFVINDVGKGIIVLTEKFLTLKQFRKNQINNILKCLND